MRILTLTRLLISLPLSTLLTSVLIYCPAARAISNASTTCQNVFKFEGGNSGPHLLFEVLPETPLRPIVRSAAETYFKAVEFGRARKYEENRKNGSPESTNAMYQIANGELAHIRKALERIQLLLTEIKEKSVIVEADAEKKLGDVANFLKHLPDDIRKFEIKGENSFLNSRPDSYLKHFSQKESLQQEFMSLQEGLKIQDLIRKLRRSGNVLSSKEVQDALQDSLVDGVGHLVRQAVVQSEHPMGWDLVRPVVLSTTLVHILPGQYGVMNNFDRKSDLVTVNANHNLINALLTELIRNGSEVTQRRHPQKSSKEYNWDLAFATTRVKGEPNGDVRIEIEDWGNSAEYYEVRGIGNSHAEKNGVGFGRFRAHLIAGFMGYEISHAAKSDNSGSIISLTIPAAHVVEFRPSQ